MMRTVVLLALAVAPGVAIAMYINYRDVSEKEPVRLLLRAFLIGFVAVIPVALMEAGLRDAWRLTSQNLLHLFIDNFIVVGFMEEVVKFFILWFVAYNRKEFNEPYDGIIFAVMIGMGLATAENIFVVLESGLRTALMRLVTTMPAHATFAVLMGYYIGLSKFRKHNGRMIAMGIGAATLFHGSYDFFLSIRNIPLIGLGAIVSLAIGVYFSFKAVKSLLTNEPVRVLQMLGAGQEAAAGIPETGREQDRPGVSGGAKHVDPAGVPTDTAQSGV